ncbi:MAG: stage IV sporulation protein A, partial [Clostridia bacterium]
DIAERTGGDIYVGVVGPVRTGKSTLIKQFMQKLVLDGILNEDEKHRAIDEMPQSADGKTIMTTQPKFVPSEAVSVPISNNMAINLRLIDCVGYMVKGALGGEEDGHERMVSTPWSSEALPFSKAAELGTEKVIREHSTIAIAVTTDGSFTNMPRSEYEDAEERVIADLKTTGKPFTIILNTADANAEKAVKLADELSAKYDAPVLLKNILTMNSDDITEIMESILLEFSVKLIDFNLPRWAQALSPSSRVISELIDITKDVGDKVSRMKDYAEIDGYFDIAEFWKTPNHIDLDAGKGRMKVDLEPKDDVYFKVLTEECGENIENDFELLCQMKTLCKARRKTENLVSAIEQVESLGYGIVLPTMDEIELQKPELIKEGQQFGVKLRATAPSLHIMKVDVEAEVSPIVGNEKQSEDFVNNMLAQFDQDKQAVWDTNIFGRTLSSLISDGINTKLTSVPSEAEVKLKKTLGRIVNEGRGGVICILL